MFRTCSTSQQAPVKIHDFNDFVGRSYTVKRAKDLIRMSVSLPKSLLLSGDTGTGKEAVAKKFIGNPVATQLHLLGSAVRQVKKRS